MTFDAYVARWPSAVCVASTDALRDLLRRELGFWPIDCAAELADAEAESRLARMRDAIDEGAVTFHGDAAARCVCALERGVPRLALPPACADVFEGHAAPGAACTYDEECAPNAICDGTGTQCSGRCVHVAVPGDPCEIYADCSRPDARLFCAGDRCAYRADLNEPCVTDGCLAGTTCDPASTRCVLDRGPTTGLGQSCAGSDCDEGLVCVETGAGPRCDLPRTDGTCRLTYEGSDCPPGTRCDTSSIPTRCVASPSCIDGFCVHGLRCDGPYGACHPVHHVTYACAYDSFCLSGDCGPVSQCVAPSACP